jgi:predicted patatin/cPLA2 family phospholipase
MKTAVILSGGGMRAAFCVGALLELHEKGVVPDIVIAGSGSAGTGSYFVSSQYKSIPFIWGNLLSTKNFINLWRVKRVLNVDYLIDEVFKKQEPLDAQKVLSSPIYYSIPATNTLNGEIHYFSNRECSFDVFECMRATMAYPVLYGKQIEINHEKYSDGIFSASPYFHIKKAKELGAEKIFVVDSGARTNKFLYKVWLLFKNKTVRKNHLAYLKTVPETEGVVVIAPVTNLKFNILDNKKTTTLALIEAGRESVRKLNI